VSVCPSTDKPGAQPTERLIPRKGGSTCRPVAPHQQLTKPALSLLSMRARTATACLIRRRPLRAGERREEDTRRSTALPASRSANSYPRRRQA
jgi:hypothetical protein